MSHKQHNIEELLELMGSHEQCADPEHRYELRRNLLCSRLFEDVCERQESRWDRVMTYTAPLFAGSVIMGVFALMAVYAPVEPEVGPQISSQISSVNTPEVAVVDVAPLNIEDFVSDPNEPKVSLADFVSQDHGVFYTPISSQEYIRTQ